MTLFVRSLAVMGKHNRFCYYTHAFIPSTVTNVPCYRKQDRMRIVPPSSSNYSTSPVLLQAQQKQKNMEVCMDQNKKRAESTLIETLRDSGAMEMEWPIVIRAESLSTYESVDGEKKRKSENDGSTVTKLIHFQRHGEGYHNLISALYREAVGTFDVYDPDPKANPLASTVLIDSPLTHRGYEESAARQVEASACNPEVIIVSPLQRAVQTALITFEKQYHNGVPFVAHEGCRERLGLHTCNKRRPLSRTCLDFPQVDFSLVPSDEDVLWMPGVLEKPIDEANRAYQFMTEFVMTRPEKEMAIVCHSAWLLNLFNCVIDCSNSSSEKDPSTLFSTAEIRSVVVTFLDETARN